MFDQVSGVLGIENAFERLPRGFGGTVRFRLGRGSFFFRGCGGRFFFRGRGVLRRHVMSHCVRVTDRDIGALPTLASGVNLALMGHASVVALRVSFHCSNDLFCGTASGNHGVENFGLNHRLASFSAARAASLARR